jgi:hypothetical protein
LNNGIDREGDFVRSSLVFALQRLLGSALGLVVFSSGLSVVLAQTAPPDTDSAPAGAPSRAAEGLLSEPRSFDRAIRFMRAKADNRDGDEIKNGIYPELSNMITGAGWISLGPGYRHWLMGDRAFVDASAALSWRSYKMAQMRFEVPRLAADRVFVGTQFRWQDLTQVTYFGEGAESAELDRSEFRLNTRNIVAYATMRPSAWLSVGGRVGWLDRPSVSAPAGSFKRGNPDTREVFPDDIVYTLSEQPGFVHSELFASIDTRDHRGHPTSGAMYRGSWADYRDHDAQIFTFRRFEAEGAHFLPAAGARLVFPLRGSLIATDTSAGNVVPFYMLPSLGGNNTIRSYTDFRFHDRDMLLVNAEARLAVFTHLDGVFFVDAGNVAPRVADLDLDKRAYVRVHTDRSTFARVDVAHGVDGWRLVFRLNDPCI